MGIGEQEIKKITEDIRIDFEIRFIKPFETTSPAFMTTEAVNNNQTKVVWGFSGKIPYPINLWFLFMDIEKNVSGDLETELSNLKNVM